MGIVGFPLMGYLQDTRAVEELEERPALVAHYVDPTPKDSVFGQYQARNEAAVKRIRGIAKLHEIRTDEAKALGAALTPDALAKALAGNKGYVDAVRVTHDIALRAEGDNTPMTYEQMLAALEAGGLVVSDADFQATFATEYATIDEIEQDSARHAMQCIAVLPVIMAVCYLGLIIYFRATGGYRAVELSAEGKIVGEHPVTLEEALSDETAGPSE